jgi:hypothetical protein
MVLRSLVFTAVLACSACSSQDQAETSTTGPSIQQPGAEAAFTGSESSSITESEMSAAIGRNAPQSARDAVISKLPTTTIDDNGTPRTRYVWEGDMLLSREEVNAMLRAEAPGATGAGMQPELKVMVDQSGNPTFWSRGQRALTYVVNRRSFPSPDKADLAVRALSEAARDWQNACPACGLTIREVPTGNATFTVTYQPQNVPYVAAAFFPADPPWRRVVYIAAGFYRMGEDPAGVLRHELGHTLGYRHEHIAGVPGCRLENNQWTALTPYDPRSVMHYPCGGGGTRLMQLSPSDVAGHTRLYS